MCVHDHRALVNNGITPVEWAILSSTSYLLPLPPSSLIIHAQAGSEEDFSMDELKEAVDQCAARGWIIIEENGITLSDEGRHTWETLEQVVMESVALIC